LLSPELYRDIQQYVAPENVFYCPNGIPDVRLLNLIVKDDKQPCRLLFLSNMMKSKGVYQLLEACKILKNQQVHFECHFVGSWSDISELEFNQALTELDLKTYVISHGKKYGESKQHFYAYSDIFIHPTLNDCFPLVILEAMASSLPIISTNEGAIPSLVIPSQNGYLVKKNCSQALADAIQLLIVQPEKRKEMGVESRKLYENFYNLDKFEAHFVSTLNTILS